VRDILLDDEGFWKPLSLILYSIAMPPIKLLRALNGTKPVLGKVCYRMFLAQERLKGLQAKGIVPWVYAMITIHEDRWRYLHDSDFHSAAYALDPEFMNSVKCLDEEVMKGLHNVLLTMCLRVWTANDPDRESKWQTYTVAHPAVVSRATQADREFQKYKNKEGAFSTAVAALNSSMMSPKD
tara:strand:- start:490 stop:1035 length:546 start_codon:yes stop_codon:yes gene_type:complete